MKYDLTAMRIREAMSDMNITQQELADKAKIGKSSISHYVNGSNEPGNKSAYAMAQVLNVNPAWLMGLNVPKHTDSIEEDMKQLERANEFYELYKNADPDVKAAIETILKSSRK